LKNFEKSKEKLVTWIEMCNHYCQNKSRQGECQTKKNWHSRCKCYPYTTKTVPFE